MYMDGLIYHEFQQILASAKWNEDKGDYYFNQPYYEEAKRWYLNAMFEYKKAYDYAEKYDDYQRKMEADGKYREAERKRQKAIDKLNEYVYGK